MNKRILLVSPHVDDVELMVGGSIIKWLGLMNFDIFYVAMSSAISTNPFAFDTIQECNQALNVLGVRKDNIMLYDFVTRYFYESRQKILDTLIWLRKELNPDVVIIPSKKDKHQDHHVISKESQRAFSKCNIFEYEQPWNCDNQSVNYFVILNEDELKMKKIAISEYVSQSKKFYTDPEFIESMARFYGGICREKYAEAFVVNRIKEVKEKLEVMKKRDEMLKE